MNTQPFRSVFMVMESTGTNTDRNAILEISAVKFDPVTGAFDENWFQQPVTMPPNRYWDERTRAYWNQNREEFDRLFSKGLPFEHVWPQFLAWCQPVDNLQLWCRPDRFVWNFLQSYCQDYRQTNPFAFYNVTDYGSFLKGLHHPNPVPKLDEIGDFDGFRTSLVRALTNIKLLQEHIALARPEPEWEEVQDAPPWRPE